MSLASIDRTMTDAMCIRDILQHIVYPCQDDVGGKLVFMVNDTQPYRTGTVHENPHNSSE